MKRGRTKWRIVFDASSHESNAPSLNEALEMGPKFLLEILAIQLRLRLHHSAIVGDIMQAFLQLVIDKEDRDLTRFFLYRTTIDGEGRYHTTDQVITYLLPDSPLDLLVIHSCSLRLSGNTRKCIRRRSPRLPLNR